MVILSADIISLPWPFPLALYFGADRRQENGTRWHSNKMKVFRCFQSQQDSSRRSKVEDYVVGDTMTWVRLVKDNFQRHVTGTVHQLKAHMSVLVHYDGHTGNEHEYRWHRYSAVVSVTQDHDGLLLSRLATFPFVLRYEDS
jgi:hypothetical protein